MEEVILKDTTEKGPEVGPEAGLEDIDFAPLIDYFGMDRPSLDEKNELRGILEWLSAEGARDKADQLTKLKQLELRLGSPPTGERRLGRLLNYMKLDMQIGRLLKEQSAYVHS